MSFLSLFAEFDFSSISTATIVTAVMILLIPIAFIAVVKAVASRYKKVAPNEVLVIYGRRSGGKSGKGFRIVAGGGSLILPIVEDSKTMSTEVFQVSLDEKSIPNQDNVPINVRGVATCKIDTTDEALQNAAQSFLGQTGEEIARCMKNILLGHLRSIIGKMDIGAILRNRDAFNRQVIEESTEELQRLGFRVVTLVIQEVTDALGYIEALGKKAVAEAIQDATIKVAEAEAGAKKKVSDATRDAEITVANNAVLVAEANKNRDVQSAQYKVLADTEIAKANQALAIATAQQEQTLKVKEAERDAAETEARIEVSRKEAERMEQELVATVIRPAEAEQKRTVIAAEAAKQKLVIEASAQAEASIAKAEGDKQAKTLEGQGEAAKMTAEAEGQAAMTRQTLLAKAEGEAAVTQKALMAEAEGQAAMKKLALLGEAEGTERLAEALAKLTDAGKLILILDRLPALTDHVGEALSKVMREMFSSVAAGLSNIDEIRIIDVGGNGNGLNQVAGIVPTTVFKTIAALGAQGIDIKALAAKIGIDITKVEEMLGAVMTGNKADSPAPATTTAEVAPTSKPKA